MNIRINPPDWKLLRQQKNYCLNEANNNEAAGEIYDGLVNLIDHIQDEAVAQAIATEAEVFGE